MLLWTPGSTDVLPFRQLIDLAQKAGLTVGAAESVTGGLLGYLLAREPGAGDVFKGTLVTYRSEVKYDLLGLPRGPVVSSQAAAGMAAAARRLLGADLALSLTGVAGPDEQDGMPVGTVFLALAEANRPTIPTRHCFAGSPDQIRLQAARQASLRALERLQSG